jgi:quercetin dioxygenase-like cupin family protein
MNIYNFNNLTLQEKRAGVFTKVITGKKMQMCYIKLKPGQVTNHHHPHEQMGYIISGKVELTIGEEKIICTKGFGYHIPRNVKHGFKVLSNEDLVYVEFFSPPKLENVEIS